jgi:SAM-dependent methyltransferase
MSLEQSQQKIWDYFQDSGVDDFMTAIPRLKYLLKKAKKYCKGKNLQQIKALNVGVGSGWLEKKCKHLGVDTYALDPSQVAISKLVAEGIHAVQGSIAKMPFADNFFNVIFCSEIFEHLSDDELLAGLQEVSRTLSNGGLLIGTVPFNEILVDNRTVCPGCGHVFHRWGHQQSFNKNKLHQIILKSGLKIIDLRVMAYPDFSRPSIKDKLKSAMRWVLGLCGANIACPNLFFLARK